jgi:hypothetical protein
MVVYYLWLCITCGSSRDAAFARDSSPSASSSGGGSAAATAQHVLSLHFKKTTRNFSDHRSIVNRQRDQLQRITSDYWRRETPREGGPPNAGKDPQGHRG